jgi:hypothetical protein
VSGYFSLDFLLARGTGEYDRNTTGANGQLGKFGIVVGDPLVDSVVKLVPNSRGYPVQVISLSLTLVVHKITGSEVSGFVHRRRSRFERYHPTIDNQR